MAAGSAMLIASAVFGEVLVVVVVADLLGVWLDGVTLESLFSH